MQIVPSGFNQIANGDVIPLSWGIRISFDKAYDDSITWFTLDQSTLNSGDLLAPIEDNPLQAWDFYEYKDFAERLVYMSVQKSIDFPYSVVSAIADFQLNNYDQYFTPNGTSPVANDVLPKRPVRLLLGLSNVLLPQFVGLTEGMPEIERTEGLATFTAMDFLTWIYDMDIRETIAMQNVRTDEVLANIFQQFGLAPDQYDLARGRNTIPFLFFEADQVKAGDIIRPLMQAEMGRLWLDEQGIIRFTPRLEQPTDPVYLLDDDNIEDIEHSGDDEIINRVVIITQVREVQEYQSVYSKSKTDTQLNVVPANGTYVFVASLQDPALTIEDPDFGENAGVSWFTAATPDGTPVVSGVSVDSTELKTNSFNITFNNTNNFAVNIDQLFLWGRPAKNITVEPVIYENKDTDSIAKYEEQTYEINNNFIQDIDDARSLALTMLDEYSEHADIVTVTMSKPNPALQLSDIIDIDYEEYSGEYRIIAMNIKLQDAKMTQVLTCRRYQPRTWFQLDVSQLNGTDVLAP